MKQSVASSVQLRVVALLKQPHPHPYSGGDCRQIQTFNTLEYVARVAPFVSTGCVVKIKNLGSNPSEASFCRSKFLTNWSVKKLPLKILYIKHIWYRSYCPVFLTSFGELFALSCIFQLTRFLIVEIVCWAGQSLRYSFVADFTMTLARFVIVTKQEYGFVTFETLYKLH